MANDDAKDEESKSKEDCTKNDENRTSFSVKEENANFDTASEPIAKKEIPPSNPLSQKNTNKSVADNQNAKSTSSDLSQGPEIFEVEEPPPPPPATIPGAFAVGGPTRTAGDTTRNAQFKGDGKALYSKEKNSNSAIKVSSTDLNSSSLPPHPEVLAIEEPMSDVGKNGGGVLKTDDMSYQKEKHMDILVEDMSRNEELDMVEEPPLPTLPQRHQTIIVEPPFPPPSSQLNNATTRIDDEDPNTDSFQENETVPPHEGGVEDSLQYPNNATMRDLSDDEENTIHATRVQDDTLQIVNAECVLAETQQNNEEAILIDKSGENKMRAFLKSKNGRTVLCISLLIIIALATGIGIAMSRSNSGGEQNADIPDLVQTPSLSPSSSPTLSAQPSFSPSISNVPTAAPLWMQVGQDMNGIIPFEEFGDAVSISKDGKRVAIGSPAYYKTDGVEVGRVVIYDSTNGPWNRTGNILGDNAKGQFGEYVTFSGDGNRIAIGENEYSDPEKGRLTGQVRIFEYKSGSWEPLGEAIIGESGGGKFGTCLAFSEDGNILAASGTTYDGLNGSEVGRVNLSKYLNGTWTRMGDSIFGEGAGDRSGHRISVSSDGRVIAIGGHHNDNENGLNSGHVRVYRFDEEGNGTSWKKVGQDINGEEPNDRFGWTVSLSSNGNILAAGARRSDAGGEDSGAVWIYHYNNETDKWDVFGRIAGDSKDDSFGHEVSLSSMGDIVAISALEHDGINGKDSGYVKIYKYDSQEQEWAKVGGNLYGKGAGDEFGKSLSISGDGTRVAIGAPFNDDAGVDSGMVQIYEAKKWASHSA